MSSHWRQYAYVFSATKSLQQISPKDDRNSTTLGRSVLIPKIAHLMQRPGEVQHRGKKDDVDEQEGVLVQLRHNLDLLVVAIVVGDGVFIQPLLNLD